MKTLRERGAVFLDLDGTALRPDHSLGPAMREAVKEARKLGIQVVLCSSRSPVGIRLVQNQLDIVGELMIAFQGAMVCAWKDDELVVHHEDTIDDQAVALLEAGALSQGLSISAYAGLTWRCLHVDAAIDRAASINHERPTVVDTILDPAAPPHKVLVIAPEPDRLSGLGVLEQLLPASVVASRSHVNYLEVTTAGVDKGTGLLGACAILGLRPEDTTAAGDGFNDLPMLLQAGRAIVMGQAPDAVKRVADVVIGDNTTDDLAVQIRQLGLQNNLTSRSNS